jgi:hypothetical protein
MTSTFIDCIVVGIINKHRDQSIHKGMANMHCQRTACTRSLLKGLITTVGQKPECFKWTANNIF